MTTHDFRPGDVVEWHFTAGRWTVREARHHHVCLNDNHSPDVVHWVTPNEVVLIERTDTPPDAPSAPTEYPSRSRAASSLRAASASLTTAIDHLTRAGEAETYPGQSNTRTRTAAEETQACIHHATMALYWMLHERLGS